MFWIEKTEKKEKKLKKTISLHLPGLEHTNITVLDLKAITLPTELLDLHKMCR